MARKDLLSEAIADAKAVKETALANAKLALEEAFTPQLQSMISAKLAEEAEEEEELDMVDDEMESDDAEESELELDMDSEEDMYMDSDDEMEMDSEEELESEEYDEAEEDEMTEEEDDLDLESIIKELEAEMEDDSDVELTDEDELEDVEEEEEIDLDEIIRTLKEMEGDDEEEVESDEEVDDVVADLEEAYKTIESLQSTINEVNLLNAKLLYTNKLFRTFDLNEGQKIKVLENFDRTTSVREVKLVFTTLAENLNVVKKKKIVVKEGYASKVTRSSAPKKIISEGNEMAARWKKLAGLK
jgi:hypothetical protein